MNVSQLRLIRLVKYIYYDKEILYSANDYILTYVKISSELFDREDTLIVESNELKIRRIESKLKIHAIVKTRWNNMIVMFETHDN